ncbi:MAG: hypothetical protein M3P27_10685 [Acidobacteriota bacterium]|nr:hypothetical protein [Acidobacteriota bacterium]
MRTRFAALFLLLLFVFPRAAHPIDRARYRELNAKARALAKQQDWQGVREVLTTLGQELPAPTPRYLLTVASVETHLGHKDEALKWLARYAAMGLAYDVAADDDLKPLLAEPGFAKIAATMSARTAPITTSEMYCALAMVDGMPEDITHDGAGFVVSSVQHRTLYRLRPPQAGDVACELQEVPLEEAAKHWPTLAVAADGPRRLLWLTTSAMPGFSDFPKEDEGKAALLAVNSRGQITRRFDFATAEPAVLGDMTLAPDGTIYVTDSVGGGVYRVRIEVPGGKSPGGNSPSGKSPGGKSKTSKIEKLADGLFSPQTPVLAADQKRLFVADYSMGIAVIDLAGGKPVAYMPHPEDIAVTGIDGLYLAGDALIAIQNGTEPARVVRLRLDGQQRQIVSAEVMEQGGERLGDPTHAVVVEGWLYVIGNVGWNKVDASGKLKAGQDFTAPVVLRFPLNGSSGSNGSNEHKGRKGTPK